jgi:GH15 family glucan-1,4-alpha-glucosidase
LLSRLLLVVATCLTLARAADQDAAGNRDAMELSRSARPWEFLSAVGTRSALLGNESGRLEAWVYPLEILSDFHLSFRVGGTVLPAESLVRTVVVRPESTVMVYAYDSFSIRETLFAPVGEPGAVIAFEVQTSEPVEIEVSFRRDFQLEWPGAIGGVTEEWDPSAHAFRFGEDLDRFAALVGSPSAAQPHEEYETNYSSMEEDSFSLGVVAKGKATKLVVIAGSSAGQAQATAEYERLSASYAELLATSASYYQNQLRGNLKLELPDARLEQAYDWAQVSMLQGMVENPFLGKGLVAGYRTSSFDQRPGFAWFFGRDALWSALAFDSSGDFADTRTALEFLSRYQRQDGKIPHEISQSASFVPWFTKLPYAFAAADATPLYIIAFDDYVTRSGDLGFATEKWDSLWRAYQFLRSTYDDQGFPQNYGVGHGWVEGGPLLPVKTELYQSALGLAALRSLAQLAARLGKTSVADELAQAFVRQKPLFNRTFWLEDKGRYAFALDQHNVPVDTASVLATVPMWFGVLDPEKADRMITELASSRHQTDWGMRILSSEDPKYQPGGYHFGVVWPLFTGWASVGEYRYHRAFSAYSNLRSNALLALDGSLGHVTEALSGDYYQTLSSGSPHQIWSAAMVINPIVLGLLDLRVDAIEKRVSLAPHIPPDWTSLGVRNLRVGGVSLDLEYRKSADEITLKIDRTGVGECGFEYSPGLSLRARVVAARVNGHPVPFTIESNPIDQHVLVRFPVALPTTRLSLRVERDFGVSEGFDLPPLGSPTRGLRVLAESWSPSRDQFALTVSGTPGESYELPVWNGREVSSIEAARWAGADGERSQVRVEVPPSATESESQVRVIFHFPPE